MKRPALTALLAVAALLALGGCDFYDPGDTGRQYVVESYLQAGAPLPPVRVSRTAPVNATFDAAELAVRGAEVRIFRLDDAGGVARTYRYAGNADRSGLYRPLNREARVRPLARYRLEVTPPDVGDGIDAGLISAETVVPDTFRLVATSGDSLRWQQDDLTATITRSAYPGRQARYIVTNTALEPNAANLTPVAAELLDRAGDDLDLGELAVTESPIINEGNYKIALDGTLTIDIPWLVASFYGPNKIAVRALGDSYYDFVRSQNVQQGGSTFSPGEIPNVIERVSGGTGLFGSYAVVRFDLEVERPEL